MFVETIKGIYGDKLVKLLKLTAAMQHAIANNAAYDIAPNTTRALIKRGLASDVAGSYGRLNDDGKHVAMHLLMDADAHVTCETCELVEVTAQAVPEISLPVIPGHRWERHTLPGEAVTEHSTYQAVVATSNCQVSGYVSYQARTGTWTATGRRNGMSAMVSANSWGGVSLPEALEALAVNVAENEAAYAARAERALVTPTPPCTVCGIEENHIPGGNLCSEFTPVSYGEPMEATDYDRMNAAAERADIDAENERERAAEESEAQWADVANGEAAYAAMDAEKLAAQVASADMHDDLLAELFPGDDDPHTTYAEYATQLRVEIMCCHECAASGVCDDHVSVEAAVRAERARAELPVAMEMDGYTFTLSLIADASAVVMVGTLLVDIYGEDFTVMGAQLSHAGTRVLMGSYADGGMGSAPMSRFRGLMFRTWLTSPTRPVDDRENGAQSTTARMSARVTTSPWKTSAKSSKRKRHARR